MRRDIRIIGGGPAGSAAAVAALRCGADVHIVEKSRAAHHKVCGEFISAEACQILRELGVWDEFARREPARMHRCRLRFGRRVKEWKLDEPAFGLSRRELDRLLLDHAAASGAKVSRGERAQRWEGTTVVAVGRGGRAPKSGRLFAFKSHFDGPIDDAVEVYFGPWGYVGLSPVENGITNVCGIVPETVLHRYQFRFDDFVADCPEVAARLKPLARRMPWLATGPLVFAEVGGHRESDDVYPAGDTLGFVDPFTGSGILNALLTGRMAGTAAAQGIAPGAYLRACRASLRRPFAVSAVFRALLNWGCAGYVASLVPGDWIYRLTRAHPLIPIPESDSSV